MDKKEVDDILGLYNEAGVEAASRSLPEYLVFAEKIISRELELAAKAICFQCAEGIKVEKKANGGWEHKITGASGYELREPCRANQVRMRRG